MNEIIRGMAFMVVIREKKIQVLQMDNRFKKLMKTCQLSHVFEWHVVQPMPIIIEDMSELKHAKQPRIR